MSSLKDIDSFPPVEMLTTTESRVVAEIPEKDSPSLSDSNSVSEIDNVPHLKL